VLDNDELRFVWRAAEKVGYPFGKLVQALVLSGQRLREISDASWGEVDLTDNTLTVPKERMKGRIGHVVPLTPRMIELLEHTNTGLNGEEPNKPARPRKGAFIFSTTSGARPVSGFSKAKARLDRTIAELVAEERKERPHVGGVRPWVIHDLRRTVRTRLSGLRVLPLVAELVIGHKQGGIHKVYDLHRYDAEKRDALLQWEASLISIVDPPPAQGAEPTEAVMQPVPNVIQLRR
jgi:integrase